MCRGRGIHFGGCHEMKDFIAYLAKALVDSPEQVTVNEVRGEQAAAVELSVGKNNREAGTHRPRYSNYCQCRVQEKGQAVRRGVY